MFKFVSFVFLVFTSKICFACACFVETQEEIVKKADFIYFGQITKSILINESRIENELKIIEVLKGTPDSHNVTSYVKKTSCDNDTSVGMTYIVFGYLGKTPVFKACSETTRVRELFYPELKNEIISLL